MTNINLMSAGTTTGNTVRNHAGEELGKIEEYMLDFENGRIAYAVLSFGGIMGIGNKLFAVPCEALVVDRENEGFLLGLEKEKLKDAPGFDKSNWPSTANAEFLTSVYSYYGTPAYWLN